MLFKCLIIASIIAWVSANAITQEKKCRTDIEALQNFELDKYMGVWYQIEGNDTPFIKRTENCILANYTKSTEDSFDAQHGLVKPGGERRNRIAAGKLVAPPSGKVALAYQPKTPGTEANYFIIDTDYDNFAFIWSCARGMDIVWVLSRTPALHKDMADRVTATKEKYFADMNFIGLGQYCS